jgi:Fur family zinc uptake transcriptional regulator
MPRTAAVTEFPKRGHNHKACGAHALAEAEQICRTRGARLTALRKRVLETVWQSHGPMGAYDILAHINAGGERNAPMAVYRALDFLMEQGLVHRISSLNAFVGCPHPGHQHSGQFLICNHCNDVAELESDEVSKTITKAAKARGFKPTSNIIEVMGLCPNCRDDQ